MLPDSSVRIGQFVLELCVLDRKHELFTCSDTHNDVAASLQNINQAVKMSLAVSIE
jgi:hypothetical protein